MTVFPGNDIFYYLFSMRCEREAPTVTCPFFMYFYSRFFKVYVICFFIGVSNNTRVLRDVDNFRMNLSERASFQFKFEAC